MKWLKRVLAVLVSLPALAAALLYLAGQREEAGRCSATVDVARPASAVFRYFADEKLLSQWTGLTVTDSEGKPWLRPGGRSLISDEARGRRTQLECEVGTLDAGRSFSLVLKSLPGTKLGFEQHVDYSLQEQRGGTRVAVRTATRYEGAVLRLLEPLATGATCRQLQQRLDSLKSRAEAEP